MSAFFSDSLKFGKSFKCPSISFADEKFIGKGKLVTRLGCKAIYKNVAKSESEEEESILPPVKENEAVKYVSGKVTEKTTKPPTRFTPSTLLQAMKEIHSATCKLFL
ncbi:MAG: hypothetical protein J5497_03035 [Selenomonadaceae bacterium]|nr:hypothetical protein [Selenomonadaceae bacterium]